MSTTINDNIGVCEEECPRFQVLAGLNDKDVEFLKTELGISSNDGLIDLEPDDIQDDEIRPIKKRRLLKTAKYLSLGYSIESDTTLRHIHNVAKAGIEASSEGASSPALTPYAVNVGMNEEVPYVYFEGVRVPEHVKFVITDRSVKTVKEQALIFHQNVQRFVVTKNVTTMKCRALYACSNLKNVVFEAGSSLRHIGAHAIHKCRMIEEMNLPASLKTLGKGALMGCERLKKVKLSPKMTTIEQMAFSECPSLTAVEGMNVIQSIGDGAFYYCKSLETIDVNQSANIYENAFEKCNARFAINRIN
jgi:hypothetical protein